MTHIDTKLIHEGSEPDPTTGAVMPPIYMTSTYAQNAPGVHQGYDYTRAGNPNFTRLETLLAAIEKARFATIFSSGLGALTALIHQLNPGDRVLALDGVYGGTWRLFTRLFVKFGIRFDTITPKSLHDLEKAFDSNTRWLFFETPTNPLMRLFPIADFAAIAKAHGALTVVDNTFATPYFQNPLLLGADVVWHSTTKYLSGHSDVIGGALITDHADIKKLLDFNRMALGLNPSPFDAWLTMRGVKTLSVRMERHRKNGRDVAAFLKNHPLVKTLFYPDLEKDPTAAQMSGFPGIVSADFALPADAVKQIAANFSLFTLAESLGGVESLVCHPVTMTHASLSLEARQAQGITDTLLRFSVGLENSADLIEDIRQTLEKYAS